MVFGTSVLFGTYHGATRGTVATRDSAIPPTACPPARHVPAVTLVVVVTSRQLTPSSLVLRLSHEYALAGVCALYRCYFRYLHVAMDDMAREKPTGGRRPLVEHDRSS